jgi:hypothetical protein
MNALNNQPNPQKRKYIKLSVVSNDLGDELMTFDSLSNQVHILNTMAKLVWEMCDGQRGIEDIAIKIANEYQGTDYDSVLKDTDAIFNEFETIGLVTHSQEDYSIKSKASCDQDQTHLKSLRNHQYVKPSIQTFSEDFLKKELGETVFATSGLVFSDTYSDLTTGPKMS